MKYLINQITEDGLHFELNIKSSLLDELVTTLETDGIRIKDKINVKGTILKIRKTISVSGTVKFSLILNCGRCLKMFPQSFSNIFDVLFVNEAHNDNHSDDIDNFEFNVNEAQHLLFDGNEISLNEPIQDNIILSIPIQPLCAKNCKGLCPKCGIDLNQEKCRCQKTEINPQFAALKNLKL